MPGIRMVHLMTVQSGFEGRVLAARLGSEGVVVQLRGAVDGPYPFGEVLIDVSEEDLATASELLLADQVASVFEPAAPLRSPTPAGSSLRLWLTLGTVVLIVATSVVARFV